MADFTAAGADEAARLAHGEGRHVVMQHERLGRCPAGEAVHVLGLLGRPEGRDDEALGVAALEDGAAVHAGEDPRLARDGAERLGVPAVGAHAALEDRLAVGIVLQFLEDDAELVVGEVADAEFGDEGGLRLLLQLLDVAGADGLFLAEDRVGNLVRGHALHDRAGGGLGTVIRSKWAFFLPVRAVSSLIALMISWMDGLVREGQGLDEAVFRDLVRGTLDHQHVLLRADVDQVEGGGEHLLDGGIDDELAVDLPDARGGDRPVPRNVGDGEGGAGAVQHRDVGLVDLVGGKQEADDLDLIEEAFREERAAGPVAEAGGEDFLLGGPAFALEVSAGKAARGGVLFAIING